MHGWMPTATAQADCESMAHAERRAWRATHSLEARIVKLEEAVAELQSAVKDLCTETDEVEVELSYLQPDPLERWVPGDGVTTPDEVEPVEPTDEELWGEGASELDAR